MEIVEQNITAIVIESDKINMERRKNVDDTRYNLIVMNSDATIGRLLRVL